jgi:hypothetical protein
MACLTASPRFPLLSAAVIAGLFRPLRMETTPRSSLAPHLVRDGGGIGAATQKGAWRGWRGARAKVLLTAEEGEGIRSAKFLLTDLRIFLYCYYFYFEILQVGNLAGPIVVRSQNQMVSYS